MVPFQSPCLLTAPPNSVPSFLLPAARGTVRSGISDVSPIRQVSQGQARVLFDFLIMTVVQTQMPLNPRVETARHTLIRSVGKGNMSSKEEEGNLYINIYDNAV